MKRLTAVILPLALLLTACQKTAPPPTLRITPPAQILRIGLAASAAPFADLVSDRYAATTERASLQFVAGNSETIWADLENGRLDAIFVHHIPAASQNWFNPVALDGLTILVHPDNPVEALSLAEAQALFNGRIPNWQEVGGANQPVTIISREAGSGALTLLNQMVLVDQRLNINARIAPTNQLMLELVSDEPHAIGFSMMGQTANVKRLTIEGVKPAPDTATRQIYPLTTPLYFVHRDPTEPEGELRAFLAWLQSEAGQGVIGEQYGRVR